MRARPMRGGRPRFYFAMIQEVRHGIGTADLKTPVRRRPRDVPLPSAGGAEFRKETETVKAVFSGRGDLGARA